MAAGLHPMPPKNRAYGQCLTKLLRVLHETLAEKISAIMEIIISYAQGVFPMRIFRVSTLDENDSERLRQERKNLHARCIALNLEQRRTLQGFLGTGLVSASSAGLTRGTALQKCASLQAEFLRTAGELRRVSERLLPHAAER